MVSSGLNVHGRVVGEDGREWGWLAGKGYMFPSAQTPAALYLSAGGLTYYFHLFIISVNCHYIFEVYRIQVHSLRP